MSRRKSDSKTLPFAILAVLLPCSPAMDLSIAQADQSFFNVSGDSYEEEDTTVSESVWESESQTSEEESHSNVEDVSQTLPEETSEEATAEQTEDTEETEEEERPSNHFSVSYFGLLYGPALESPSAYQPKVTGEKDPSRPLLIKNYLTLGYDIASNWFISGTAFFHWVPVMGHKISIRDPYLRFGNHSILQETLSPAGINYYADVRVHFPISPASRQIDLLAAFQTLQTVSWQPEGSRFTFNLTGSARLNVLGSQGEGNDLELYLGPSVAFQLLPSVSLSLLYEMGMSHPFGEVPFVFFNDGMDIQPGLEWQITPQLTLNPFLNFYVGGKANLKSTSFGVGLSWDLT